jgi:NAD(P)-dependent dehydrogenase (short-subunit alcohol dehydrogenase family)
MKDFLDLVGKRILVTGASGDIGRDVAILLSEMGASLVICGRNQSELLVTERALEGRPCVIESINLKEVNAISDWMKSLAKSGGPLFGLVHCAGISERVPIRMMKWQKAEEIMQINWGAAWALAKAFRQTGVHEVSDSRIVMVSSTAGLVGESALSAYCSSKGAVIALARSLAAELASEGIRVNTVAPGFIRTRMNDRYLESLTPEQLKKLEARHLLGFGSVADVSGSIAFLLAKTGRWITGTTITVDGGLTAI